MISKFHNSIDINEIFNLLSSDGVVHLKHQSQHESLDELNREFDLITKGNLTSGCSPIELSVGKGVSFNFTSENKDSVPETFRFFKQSWMQEMSDKFWSNRITLNPNLYVMHELPGTQHIAQDLHFDVKKTLKFFLYLNDVTTTNGAFSCVPKSNKESEKIRQIYGDEISYENRHLTRKLDYTDDQVIPIEGEAGDLIIFNTDVWHRAGIVKEGERRVMRGHTQPGL